METEVDWYLGNWKETKIEPTGKYNIISVGTKALVQYIFITIEFKKLSMVAQKVLYWIFIFIRYLAK